MDETDHREGAPCHSRSSGSWNISESVKHECRQPQEALREQETSVELIRRNTVNNISEQEREREYIQATPLMSEWLLP